MYKGLNGWVSCVYIYSKTEIYLRLWAAIAVGNVNEILGRKIGDFTMKEKTTKYLYKFASVFVSVALVSMFAFPLAAIAEPDETAAPVTEETATVDTAAEEAADEAADTTATETADTATDATIAAVGGELTGTPLTDSTSGYSVLGGTMVPYTGGLDADITTFAINNGLTGHLTSGEPGKAPRGATGTLGEASYYITAPDGTVMTFAFANNDFSTSPFYVLINTTSSGILYYNVASLPINAVYTQEASPGYTAVSFVSGVTLSGPLAAWNLLELIVAVTMTPNSDGTVVYNWEFDITPASDTGIQLGGAYALDTMLNIADDVSVYSLGTNQGMYLEDASAFARVTLPWVDPAIGGPDDMAAVEWEPDAITNLENTFGTTFSNNVSYGIPSSLGDLLYAGHDSAVYYRYGFQEIVAGIPRSMVYAAGLDINPAALPATGDTSMTVIIAGLAVLAVGATLVTVAVRRRSRRQDSQ